ncbi:MAG: GNAT family N-acetyltransferase [Pseudomonadota bacterium]
MKVRVFNPADAAMLAEIFHDSVHRIGVKDYTKFQVDAWSPAPVSADRFLARVSDGRTVFVAVDGADKPLGFIELERSGHIDCFYCHSSIVRTGVGQALYRQLEEVALAMGMARLYTEASEAARRFFLRAGFTLMKRQEFEHNGVEIHNYLMEKSLR